MGYLKLPEGKRIAVNLGVDVDAQSLWLGGFNRPSPSFMSRGEFGAQVGVPRLLKLFKENNIKTTFFIPGHTVDTFPEISKVIFDAGHEIAHHGYYHENPTLVNRDTERRLWIWRSPVIKDISAYALWDTVLPIGIIARIRWIFWRKPVFSMTVA